MTLLEVIERAYAAAEDAAHWPAALAATADLLGGEGATLEVIDAGSRRPLWFRCARLAGAAPYVDEYAPLSPRAPRCAAEPAGYLGHDDACLPREEQARHPFYAEFLRPQGLAYFASANLHNDGRRLAVVTVQRTPARGHVGHRELELLGRLLPHFRRALELGLRLAAQGGAAAEVVARSALGVVFLDRRGRVVSANAAAERLLDDGGAPLRLAGRRLVAATEPERQRLEGLVRTALADPVAGGGSVVLRPPGRAPLRLTVVGLATPAVGPADAPAVAVYLIEGRRGLTLEPALLREAFGLTAAEARLALALMDGASVAAHAERAGIGIATARTHLSRVLAKTDTANQQALIRLLDGLAQGPP